MAIVRMNTPLGPYSTMALVMHSTILPLLATNAIGLFSSFPVRRRAGRNSSAIRLALSGVTNSSGMLAEHLFSSESEPGQECVIEFQVGAILGNGGRHGGRLAEQPLIVFESKHLDSVYEIS